MTKATKILIAKLKQAAKRYNETEYCECGCKMERWDGHGQVGKSRFERTLANLTAKEVLAICRAAEKAENEVS